MDSLRENAMRAVPIMAGSVVLFTLAAFTEGFLSPSPLPYIFKAFWAILSSGLMSFYFVILGFPRQGAAVRLTVCLGCRGQAMQLDRTHVVIRLRSMSEIGDLAMAMLRRYPSAMLVGFAIGALGWALANALLLGWIPIREASYGLEDEEALGEVWRYMTWMAILVSLQTPAAGVLTTLYLGQAVFEQRPTWQSVLREAKRQFRSWFWVLGVKRLAIPAMIMLAFRWGKPASAFWDVLVPITVLLVMIVIRGSRPFVPEILLLEQCPVKAKSKGVITLATRSQESASADGRRVGRTIFDFGFRVRGAEHVCAVHIDGGSRRALAAVEFS